MNIPQLQVTTTKALLGLTTQRPKQEIEQPAATLDIQQPQAVMTMETTKPKLSIDTTEARAEMDLKSSIPSYRGSRPVCTFRSIQWNCPPCTRWQRTDAN